MKLDDYLSQRGAAKSLAEKIGTTPVLISQWRTGGRPIPAERCPDIERATEGAVRCEDLRPDIDWAIVRASPSAIYQPAPGAEKAA